MTTTPNTKVLLETIQAKEIDNISVELGTQFLKQFSEQLYSSPQKAFEELISNGWDAGASMVDVRIDNDLSHPDATMSVFDNGSSMDLEGLRNLWHVAFSPKHDTPEQYGRKMIGKFGIGKLATYVLGNRLTYICKASDGIVRRVSMDYQKIDSGEGENENLLRDQSLTIYEIQESDIQKTLETIPGGDEILALIRDNSSSKEALRHDDPGHNEYGGEPATLESPGQGCWTIAILSGLKDAGRNMKAGILKRMLRASLPLGSEMTIRVNGEALLPSKISDPLIKEWEIGPDLNIDLIELEDADEREAEDSEETEDLQKDAPSAAAPKKKINITSGSEPYPYVELPKIGRITGTIKLFEEKISGGKSEKRGTSNGFHVNVLGRVINQKDSSFGLKDLSHAAWARFRMTVRADGLKQYLTTNREQFKDCEELRIFRTFLRKVFNRARYYHDSDEQIAIPDGGDMLLKSLGIISLNPLRNIVSETLKTQSPIPDLFDESGIEDREEYYKQWRKNTTENIRNTLKEVRLASIDDNSFAKFHIKDNALLVNKDHPFVKEHSKTKSEKELIQIIAMVCLLSDAYALNIGIPPSSLAGIREYRDKLMCFKAVERRKSGLSIARLLLQTQHKSESHREMEKAVSDALHYLGFEVLDLAKPGQPEGLGIARPMPAGKPATTKDPKPPMYKFIFDAKTSKNKAVKTSNINLDTINQHRESYDADYALVVAPEYQEGAVKKNCKLLKITPITGHDLERLLKYTAKYGAIPFIKFEELLKIYDPSESAEWVKNLEEEIKSRNHLTMDVFLKALNILKGDYEDTLSVSLIAHIVRKNFPEKYMVTTKDVIDLLRGLQILVPELICLDHPEKNEAVINASVEKISEAMQLQLEKWSDTESREEALAKAS